MNKFYKTLLIIILNFISFFILFIITDFVYCYKQYLREQQTYYKNIKKHKDYNDFKIRANLEEKNKFTYCPRLITFQWVFKRHKMLKNIIHIPENSADTLNKKQSILIFGCSFADGAFLFGNEKFGNLLSELTGRTTYNFAISGIGPSQMLYETRLNYIYTIIDDIPEYAIYVYIPDHIARIFTTNYGVMDSYLLYKEKTLKNGEKVLVEGKFILSWFYRFEIIKNFCRSYINNKILIPENEDKNFDLLKLYFTESRKELQKRYPDIKFIIIKYPSYGYGIENEVISDIYNSERWKEFEDLGFIIYDLDKEINVNLKVNKYTLPDGHPNAQAWSIITRKLIKDFNL